MRILAKNTIARRLASRPIESNVSANCVERRARTIKVQTRLLLLRIIGARALRMLRRITSVGFPHCPGLHPARENHGPRPDSDGGHHDSEGHQRSLYSSWARSAVDAENKVASPFITSALPKKNQDGFLHGRFVTVNVRNTNVHGNNAACRGTAGERAGRRLPSHDLPLQRNSGKIKPSCEENAGHW